MQEKMPVDKVSHTHTRKQSHVTAAATRLGKRDITNARVPRRVFIIFPFSHSLIERKNENECV